MKMNWQDAEEFCFKSGSHLASIHSKEENDFIVHDLADSGATEMWVGGMLGQDGVQWTWSDGTTWDYTNWDTNQPDNLRGKQNRFVLKTTWDDREEDQTKPFVCKTGVPTSASTTSSTTSSTTEVIL